MTLTKSKDSREQAEFRQHCRVWLRNNPYPETDMRLPPSAMEIQKPEHMRYLQGWAEGPLTTRALSVAIIRWQ